MEQLSMAGGSDILQLVTFTLGTEEYAVNILKVQEIIHMTAKERDAQSRIMIMDIQGLTIGLVVDSVSEVLRIPANTVDPTPAMATAMSTEFITGIAKLEDRLIILLDLDKLIERTEGSAMIEAAQTIEHEA
jgi:purine-binding chemotaxis protein CheW